MSHFNILRLTLLFLLMMSCGSSSDKNKPAFSITTNKNNKVYKLGDTMILSINKTGTKEYTEVTFKLNDQEIEQTHTLDNLKLGKQNLSALLTTSDGVETISTSIIINNNKKPKIYGYKIINEFPHDITSYTQGLEFYNDTLYESTGQYKESKLRKLDFESGKVLKNINLEDKYFGEGLTILNEKLYQLTWQSNTGFVYDVHNFKKIKSFSYGKSKEGWGLANNGSKLFKSDGTEAIYTLDPETLEEESNIEVYTNNGKIASLNELEWIDGRLYANIYQRNGVAIIDPKTGAVEGVVDFSPLIKMVTQHSGLDVLNGIAYNPSRNTIFVTGKRWDKLFEVEIFQK